MIPSNITRDHILQAVQYIDAHEMPPSCTPTGQWLYVGTQAYRPKYVVSIANRFANGVEWRSDRFSGDVELERFLATRGFALTRMGEAESPSRAAAPVSPIQRTPTAEVEDLRRTHRPRRPRRLHGLIIGESPPANGTFFYRANSVLFEHLHRAFVARYGPNVGTGQEFLRWFQGQGWYLEDLSESPLNRAEPTARRVAVTAGEAQLAERLADWNVPTVVLVTPLRIKRSVRRVLRALDWTEVETYELPFPTYGLRSIFPRPFNGRFRRSPVPAWGQRCGNGHGKAPANDGGLATSVNMPGSDDNR